MSKGKKKVLIIDDSSLARMILKGVIDSTDFCKVIGEASDGEEAIIMYEKLRPDLVTMDIVMPGKDGLSVINEILTIDNSALFIIVSTLSEDALGKTKPKEVKGFVSKPFKNEEILRILENALLDE